MAAWVVCALCALIIVKPQEFLPALAGFPLVHTALALTVAAAALDVLWRRLKPSLAPQVPYAFAFFLWAAAMTTVRHPELLAARGLMLATSASVFLAVSFAAASPRGLRVLGLTLAGCAALVTTVALVQAYQPQVCMLAEPDDWEGKGELKPDDRPCEANVDCRKDPPVPDGNYRCERPGPLGTATIDGRVRYRGSLADPNELSLMAGMAIPFAVALAERARRRCAMASARGGAARARPSRRARSKLPPLLTDRLLSGAVSALRAAPPAALIAAVGFMVVLARSRSGLIVFLVVLGLSFIRKSGAAGVVAACLVGPPMLVFGGRSGEEATESADERVELLREAFELIRRTKGLGVGAGQFGDESSLGMTAHNAYLLAAAETGLVGMCLFAIVLYASLKVPLAIWLGDHDVGADVRRFAPAVFVSLCGALAGIFFLSWAYKDVLYIVLGASAALHGAARAEDPRVAVRLSISEIALVCGGMFAVLIALNVVLRIRG